MVSHTTAYVRASSRPSVAVLVHELGVSLAQALESVVHRILGGEEGGTEVQGALLLAESASRYENDTRFVQDLVRGDVRPQQACVSELSRHRNGEGGRKALLAC